MAKLTFNIEGIQTEPGDNILGENVTYGEVLYLGSDSKWYRATAADKLKSTTELAMSISGGQSGTSIGLIEYGYYTFSSAVLVPGEKYYLSINPGSITTDVYDRTANVIRYIGTAYSDTKFLFNPDQTYISDNSSKVNDITLNLPLKDHTHTENEISNLDKYTQKEADLKFVPYQDAHSPIDLNTQPITTEGLGTFKGGIDLQNSDIVGVKVLQFDPIVTPAPAWEEGKMFYDFRYKTWTLYNDESETSLQVGEEQRTRVYNGNGDTILNGEPVTVIGRTTIAGGYTEDDIIIVVRAISSDKTSALNTIGIATHDIEINSYGYAATSGYIRGVDTSAYTEGSAIWLSDTVLGKYRTSRPPSPNYEVRMGGVAKSHPTDGIIYAELRIISNDHDNARLLNGTILEDHEVTIVKTPTTTSLELVEKGTSRGYLSVIIDQEYTKVTVPTSIVLTNGTDNIPTYNYIYLNNLGVLTKDLAGFPTAIQYAPVATIVAQSAVSVNTYGLYKVHAWTDHLADSRGQGHLSHLNSWIRFRPALWKSGIIFSTVEGIPQPTIPLAYTSGVVSQLHLHNFPVFDTGLGDEIYGVNNPLNPYDIGFGLTSAINTDSLGNSIGNNKYYTVIIWGVVSEAETDCKVFYNLPSGSYTNVTDALNDIDKYSNYTIPDDYTGTGFLLTQITLQRTTSTVEVITDSIKDLRGLFPASGGGGGTTGGAGITRWTELIDTPIVIEPNQTVRGNAGGTALEFYDPNFVFSQTLPNSVWTIPHPLKKYPSVTVLDSGGDSVEGSVNYVDINNLTITFNSSFSGIATLN